MNPFACLLIALLAAHCPKVEAAPYAQHAERFPAPLWYRQVWEEVEECTGLEGDIDDVTFYRVPASFKCRAGICRGLYERDTRSVYLAEQEMWNRELVAHEMAHALGVMNHPREVYGGRCDHP